MEAITGSNKNQITQSDGSTKQSSAPTKTRVVDLFDDVWEMDSRGAKQHGESLIKTTVSTDMPTSRTNDEWDTVLGVYEPSRRTDEEKIEEKKPQAKPSTTVPQKKKKKQSTKPSINVTSKSKTASMKTKSTYSDDDDVDDYDDEYDDYY